MFKRMASEGAKYEYLAGLEEVLGESEGEHETGVLEL